MDTDTCEHEIVEYVDEDHPYPSGCPENCMMKVITYRCEDCNAKGTSSYVDHHPLCEDQGRIITWEKPN